MKRNQLRKKDVSMKKMLLTLLVVGSSIYSCFAQNWNNDDKAIYTQALDSLKIGNLYTRRYGIDSSLFYNVIFYTHKNQASPPLVKYINDGDWSFITNYKSFINGSEKIYKTKKLIPDGLINYKEGFNNLSPIIYSGDNMRAIVLFETHRNMAIENTGFLFLSKVNNQWRILRKIGTNQIIN
ncbi:hypothetical protein HDF26_004523 [Pedobacter cryoconitis]|uniref:hypothetical protein n=1 Tax=Pedobacter cryoconitis TaxID=188932 RepID=UPI0016196D42|nr:hypothetical protein [Pedobacter cryoconitis]MBB6274050.1 hypothetical protein [Pedobacter cryoconitis]